ncbi:hypothetical protein BH24CHL1_BH24CHL1_06470 [soil metagenome]
MLTPTISSFWKGISSSPLKPAMRFPSDEERMTNPKKRAEPESLLHDRLNALGAGKEMMSPG